MIKIEGLVNNSKQKFILPLETRDVVEMKLYYMPTQMAWFFDFKYNNEDYTGHKLVLGANILRMYKNRLPFGLLVYAEGHIEPYKVDDLVDRVKIFTLNKDEVKDIEFQAFGVA